VAQAFAQLVPSAVVRGVFDKPHIDLWAANRALLVAAGVRPSAIDAAPPCTMHDAERFFSFRRDGSGIGQQLSFVIAAPAGA
jgi:copper oxidase (laccase) domain-containing protein